MLFNKSSMLYNVCRPAPSFLMLIAVFVYALLFSGCAGSNPLKGYEFINATLAVDAPPAPPPSIITNSDADILGVFEGSFESIFTATTAVVKETKVAKARRRMQEAAEGIDVSSLIADGILERSERYLHLAPVGLRDSPDVILLLHIDRHGIYSGPAYDGRTEFFLNAHVELIDDYTGECLWEKQVNIQEPISDHFFLSNIRSANDISEMSDEEMVDAFERISDYSADAIVRILRRDLAKARR